ncbi:hypothetical protein VTN31DRAFT_2411 [Thermomyces dupontii]|uniref:uncharacterized protein n=1 Tax=Talaromyces thermophilus TaxID=28565 RepID=UPI003743D41E
MISTLLNYFLHDDVDSFKRVLADSGAARAVGQGSKPGGSSLSSSPNLASRSKKITGTSSGASFSNRSSHVRGGATPSITRAQINAKDQQGRTLLHLVASSQKPSAIEFARALLEIPFIDLYAQDYESGWTALHRALYAGNASIAQALMARDVRDVTDYSTPGHTSHPSGGLIKVKDREKNSPFDVYNATIANHNTRPAVSLDCAISDALDYDSDDAVDTGTLMNRDGQSNRAVLKPRVHLGADEVLTFGSNKNLSLGLGDEDDRQFPEAITVERPEHLLQHFYRERGTTDSSAIQDSSCLPTLIRHKPIVFMDVVMSKLHTAVLTTDPKANLYMCGFGPGGRLGTGDQTTRFGFVCIEKGGLADKRVVSVALGQDHSIAITEQGEVFTWGGNKYGQLGYSLPRGTNKRDDTPIQCTPRQIFNPFKREVILGAAASSIHSAVFSASGLYTFGKNEGQLGLVDSDARSLEVQVTPRRVGAALFSAPIQMVSAIDKATTVLLENHEVWVFTHYGYSKVVFPLDFSSSFIKESFLATRYDGAVNRIVKITSGRNTICALSSFGEVYTVQVNSRPDTNPTKSSTTNPAKIRNSLSPPERVWSVRKSHMAVRDVAVAQDGSIIICTTSGAAWRKEKRDKVKEAGSKDYKFVRVPGLSRVVAVRSNGFGAYAVAQQDCTVTKEKISVSPSTLWHDVSQLLPFRDLARSGEAQTSGSELDVAHRIKASILASSDIEAELQPILQAHELSRPGQRGRIWIRTTNSNVRIPVHEFILAGRSAAAERALVEFRQTGHSVLSDAVVIESDSDGQAQMVCKGADFMSILNVVYFLYIDDAVDVWRQNKDSQIMPRCRQIRSEVMRIATVLELRTLERAARIMVDPKRSLSGDLDMAVKNESFFDSGDVLIHLDGGTVRAHSPILCQRSPFFAGLFYGRSGGRWLDSRRGDDVINVDLKDIDRHVFDYVLRHVYGDVEEEMFDDVRCRSLDEFIDLILDVMSAAN